MKFGIQKIGFGALCCVFFLSILIGTADASFHMQYRAKWRTDYVDGNIGTYLTGTTDTDRPAAYVWYDVYTGTGSTFVTSGILSSQGYTSYFDATNGQHYWLILTTILEKNGGLFILEGVTWNTECINGWGTPATYYYHHVVPAGIADGAFKTYTGTQDVGYHAGVAPVAAQALSMATLFDMQGRIVSVVGFEGGGSQYQGDDRLCIDWVGPGHQFWKWILAHEFGHTLSDNRYGVIWRGEPGIVEVDTDTSRFCGANTAHSLISWERIDGAQSEGFANYAASVLMHPRTSTSPVFAYAHTLALDPRIDLIDATIRTTAQTAPWPASMTTQYRYMERYCNWSMSDHGIEWDWQNFFWQVWATGANKIEMADMFDIWPGAYSTSDCSQSQWADIDGNADTYLTDPELQYFEDRAFQNGIDH
jgi:hypothetical protein